MDRYKILQDALDTARHNYRCFSCWEEKFNVEEQEEKEKIEILEAMIKELPTSDRNHRREYVGYVSEVRHKRNLKGEDICEYIKFTVDSGFIYGNGDLRIFCVDYEIGNKWFVDDKHCEYATKLKIWVDSMNYIRKVEVMENEQNEKNGL